MKRLESARKRLNKQLERENKLADGERAAIADHKERLLHHEAQIKTIQGQLQKIEDVDFYLRVEALHNESKLSWPAIEVAERYLDVDYEYDDEGQIRNDIEVLRSLLICYNK